MPDPSRRSAVAALALAAAVLAFHWRVLFTAGFALPWDLRNYHLPLATALADSIAEGEFPYWEPYSYCGRPLAANPQAAVFYPTVALAAAFGRDGLLDRLEWNVVLHVWLAGWLAFRLARRLGHSAPAALAGGFVFSLGGFFASQAQHMGSVLAAAWLPLAWEGALFRSWKRVTAAVAMAVLAGFTPMTLVLIASTMALSWRVAGAVALGLGLTAFQLGPAWDLMQESVAKYRTDWLGHGGGLPLHSLVSLVWPNAYGIFDLDNFRQPFELTALYVFCGWLGLALAILGAGRERRFAWMAAAFALAMLGESTPVGRLAFAALPEFVQRSWYWYPFLAPFCLCMALLASSALSTERLRRYAGLATLAIAIELIGVGSGRPMNTQSFAREPGVSEIQIDGSEQTMEAVRRIAAEGRVDTMGDSMLWSSGAPVSRVRSANGYDPMALDKLIQVRLWMAKGERWGAYYQVERPDPDALRAMAVHAIVARERLAEMPPYLALAAELPGRFVYRVVDPAPRLTATGHVEAFEDRRNRIRVRVRNGQPGEVVLRDAWSPAWRATVDGQAAEIEVHEGAFRRVRVGTGAHEVTMEIDRWRFWRWGLVSAAAMAMAWLCRNRAASRSNNGLLDRLCSRLLQSPAGPVQH